MFLFYPLHQQLSAYLTPTQILPIARAYLFAADAHETQLRRSGEPYITHSVSVATILAKMHMDPSTVMAALLHDVVEDTAVTQEAIGTQFGEKVAELVNGVSKLAQIHFESKIHAQAENFRKMLLAMSADIRVIFIKMADRLHNMSTIGSLRPDKRRRIALETLQIYAPIANRLGMHQFKNAFEDYAFQALYPLRYTVLKACVEKARGNRRRLLGKIKQMLLQGLSVLDVHESHILGREKTRYSIYSKMREKKLPFSEIMDIYGFRILAKNVDDCYRILGAIHSIFKPIPGRFKDYIAIPKANGYQSLHTILFGPYGVPIEIQIRTLLMDHIAESGVAAHWLYKNKEEGNPAEMRAREWLKKMLDIQQQSGSSQEFIEDVKTDLFPDEVYVFTPRGDIMRLPHGATALDFAYAIHTDIGDHCSAIRVDRRLVPLSYGLSNGQTIEVSTAPHLQPDVTWLDLVATGKAKSAIRHALKAREEQGSQALKRFLKERQNERLSLEINDKTTLNYRFAACCYPIPGDDIRGILGNHQEITIHQAGCDRVLNIDYTKHPQKLIFARWGKTLSDTFSVKLLIDSQNIKGAIAGVAREVANEDSDIESFIMRDAVSLDASMELVIQVKNRVHLARIIKKLRKLKFVMRVLRVRAK